MTLVVIVLLLLCGRLLLPDAVGEQVRRSFLKALQDHYRGLSVTIAGGRYEPSVGVILTGIVIRDARLPTDARPLLQIDRLLIETELGLERLGEGEAPLLARRVIIDGAELNAWPEAGGGWSSEKLWPLPEMGPGCPLVMASNSRFRLCRDWRAETPASELQEISVAVRQPAVGGEAGSRQLTLKGSGGFVESFGVSAAIAPDGGVAAKVVAERLTLDRLVFARLPPELRQRLAPVLGLSAIVDLDLRIGGTTAAPLQQWVTRCTVHSGRFQHPQLPHSIEGIRGVLAADPRGVRIERASYTIDGAECHTSGVVRGLSWPSPVALRVDADQLMLDRRLVPLLPEEGREIWERLQPNGRVDVRGHVQFDGQRWNFDTEVQCHSLELEIEQFPYPLREVNGIVRYRNRIATTERLTCRAGDAQLICAFQLTPPDSGSEHFIEIEADNPLPIDETLLSALTPRGEPTGKLETFVRSLAPGGSVQLLAARLGRDATGQPTKRLDLEILGGRLRYEGFPYPLYEVRGRIAVDDRSVRLSHFQAQNDGGASIQCEGVWLPPPEPNPSAPTNQSAQAYSPDATYSPEATYAGGRASRSPSALTGKLDLTFRGYGIPLDDGLRTALPLAARQTWDTLAPSGVLEYLEVNLADGPQPGPPRLTVVAQQYGNSGVARRDVSVTPVTLPYRLNISRGTVRLEGDRITIRDLDGYHGPSRLSAEGQCHRRDDGRWQLDLNLLTGSRLRPDAELIEALPAEIRGSFAKLQLREPVSLRGTTQLILPSPELPQPVFSWDVLLQLEGNRIGDAGPVHDIRGEILVRGSAGAETATADGSIRIDSMHVYDLQLTEIEGPFSIRGPRLQMGIPTVEDPSQTIPIRGRIFGGVLEMRGEMALSSGQFGVDITLDQADVAQLLADLNQSHASLSGVFAGEVHLEGIMGAANLLRGVGTAEVSHTNLYQLPLIVHLFNQLRLTPAEDVAFTDGTTSFTIDGDLLTFNELQLWGDLVALQGGGTINSRHELDLTFNTRVSPQNVWSRLVRPLSSQKYTLWTINVLGPLADPKIERRALDAVGETLERMFPVMDRQSEQGSAELGETPRSASRRELPFGAKR
ncbi:AsmA-like C-terminal region-containing protein [Candidatus Laterigemmans baculatus]|uniref:AsmA-like C-terminal region-containing protein n=1 Tax=Candidatus Laterigemmans baculatus TaxID=2770505 RepID=UPI0013DBE9B9|nr:AsmA-like C-terminal region-containing protein [Candidatus Laterigemmans baculatus]